MLRKLAGLFAVIALLTVALPAVGAAGRTQHFGPFAGAFPDFGSCHNVWAADTFTHEWTVTDNGNGTFTAREKVKDGTFVTVAGPSPGACSTDKHHGATVRAGVTGSYHGSLELLVTSSAYDPNGCASATPSPCAPGFGFIETTFPGKTTTVEVISFSFHYAAGGQGLIYHEWTDEMAPNGPEVFKGDIANA